MVGGRTRTTGLPLVGDVEGLATGLRLLPLFVFDPSIVVLFFGGFSVHTFVAHGVANELQRGSVHEGSSLNQR